MLEGKTPEGKKLKTYIEVEGYVSVLYKDKLYTRASEMPDELIQLFHKGGFFPEGVTVNENNWFELIIKEDDVMVYSDVVDASGLDESGILDLMVGTYNELRKEHRLQDTK